MEDALRAGAAVYNAGHHHAAHDAWEAEWLDLESGTDDERLLHGLIQFTAAVHHARRRNWAGATGLAASGRSYLAGLPAAYRGVGLDPVREYLRRLGADPELIDRQSPPPLTHRGVAPALDGLDLPAAALAAGALAESVDRFDEATVERAVSYAREEREEGTRTRFIALVMEFVAGGANRDLIYRRLSNHVARRRRRETDVENLFE